MSKRALELIRRAKAGGWKRLDLGNTGIVGEVPVEIWELSELEELILSDKWWDWEKASWIESENRGPSNQIEKLPSKLPSKLRQLIASETKISDITPIGKLISLTVLRLHNTNIRDISPLESIERLEELEISRTSVDDVAAICRHQGILILRMHKTKVRDLAPLRGLSSLEGLWAYSTNIVDISPLINIKTLKRLWLHENDIEDVGPLGSLENLIILSLNNTQIIDIAPLRKLIEKGVLVGNQARYTKGIDIGNCPLTNPPYEIAIKGNKAILNFWREVEEEKAIPATELKLFLLGNTTAGKSTLAHILAKGEYPAEEIRSTFGSKIDEQWTLGDKRINIWDFGGQEYFHATHQMLLNGNAIYIVMVDPAYNQDAFLDTEVWHFGDPETRVEQLEHFHYRYWLEQIQAHDLNAHVFLLWNKFKDVAECGQLRIKDEDAKLFSGKGALECFPIDLQLAFREKDKFWARKWEDIHEALDRAIQQKLMDAIVLSYWPTLRDVFADRAQTRLWMPLNEFKQLCQAPGKQRDIGNIIVYLRNMTGRILYFDRPELAGKVFLNPQHINTLIYAILSRQVIDQLGGFSLDHAKSQVEKAFQEISSLIAYRVKSKVDLTADLLLIMQEFGLIFETEKGSGKYVAPQYLPHQSPESFSAVLEFADLQHSFYARFKHYIPRHLIPRFIARKGLLAVQRNYWKHGIVFKESGATVFLWVNYPTKTISLYASALTNELEDHPLSRTLKELLVILGKTPSIDVSINQHDWVDYSHLQSARRTQARMVETVGGKDILLAEFDLLVPPTEPSPRTIIDDIKKGNYGFSD